MTLEAIRAAAVAAGAVYAPGSALVSKPRPRSTLEDDAAEPVVSVLVLGPLWLGVTRAGLPNAHAALAAAGVALGLDPAQIRAATLDERAGAISNAVTVTIDVKLAQLLATTLAVLDVVKPPASAT
jgi:hypothetical protein